MTREEYAAAISQLKQAEKNLNEQLKKNQTEVEKIEKDPNKKEELSKLKKEEMAIKKQLDAVKKAKTQNAEAKKQAENKMSFKEKVANTISATIALAGLGQDIKDLVKPEPLTRPLVERVIENQKEHKTIGQINHDKIEKGKSAYEKLADAEELKNQKNKEKADQLRKVDLESKKDAKSTSSGSGKNEEEAKRQEAEKKQMELDRQKKK